MTLSEIQEYVDKNIKYKDWLFRIGGNNVHPFLQVIFIGSDVDGSPIPMIQQCRKWQLSQYMIPTEIVRTAWKAVLAAEEHEAAELFLYKGETIFNPHIDVDALVELRMNTSLMSRNNTSIEGNNGQ